MSARATWKKDEKLKSRKRIDRVFREGKSFSVFPYKVVFLAGPAGVPASPVGDPVSPAGVPASPDGAPGSLAAGPGSGASKSLGLLPVAISRTGAPLQAGFGASSRNFKKAVDRNRIKRLSREAYRLQKAPLMEQLRSKGISMAVFFVYIGKDLPDYPTVSTKIGVALQKLLKETA
jgi:ribonuclease P protein component